MSLSTRLVFYPSTPEPVGVTVSVSQEQECRHSPSLGNQDVMRAAGRWRGHDFDTDACTNDVFQEVAGWKRGFLSGADQKQFRGVFENLIDVLGGELTRPVRSPWSVQGFERDQHGGLARPSTDHDPVGVAGVNSNVVASIFHSQLHGDRVRSREGFGQGVIPRQVPG